MPWSEDFKEQLRGIHGSIYMLSDNFAPQTYSPRFRLQMGSCMITGYHMGYWEESVGAKALEIASHPGCGTFEDLKFDAFPGGGDGKNDRMHIGTTDLGYPYLFCVGLGGNIRFGAQSVNPQSFMYTGGNLTVDVTKYAAGAAAAMPPGTLACLQIQLTTGGAHFDSRDYGQWENIFIGVFRGMSWNGTQYQLTFGDATDNMKWNSTAPDMTDERFGILVGDGRSPTRDMQRGMWFWGTGTQSPIRATTTDYSNGEVKIKARTFTRATAGNGIGVTFKDGRFCYKPDWSYSFIKYGYEDAVGSSPSGEDMWCKIKSHDTSHPTTSGNTYVWYSKVGVDDIGVAKYMVLQNAWSDGTELELPGLNTLHASLSSITGFGSGGTLEPVCVVNGTPVTELINTLFIKGYHESQVPGIFAAYASSSYRRDLINWEDCDLAHETFWANWQREITAETGTIPLGGFETADMKAPFRFVVDAPVVNGYGLINKAAGKWGCHIRFKAGGYGVAVYDYEPEYGLGTSRLDDRVPAENIITEDDIQSAEYSMHSDQIKNTYASGRIVVKNAESYLGIEREVSGSESAADSDETRELTNTWVVEKTHPQTPPVLSNVKVDTKQTAEGSTNALNYATYIKGIQKVVYGTQHNEATFRLKGLAFAHLAPGDFVHVAFHDHGGIEVGKYARYGPWMPGKGDVKTRLSQLQTMVFSGEGEERRQNRLTHPWFVYSTHCDWVNGLVTIKCVRVQSRDEIRYDGWDSDWEDAARPGVEVSTAMQMPTLYKGKV